MTANINETPPNPGVADEALIYGQFDTEPTWLALQNMAADAAVRNCVKAADFEPDHDELPYSA